MAINPPPSSIQRYMQETQKAKMLPDDPYKHAAMLIDTDADPVLTFSQLIEKHVLLSNISDDRMLRLYQNDVLLLAQMCDMASREPELQNFFKKTYYGWRGELSLTRTKDGTERKLQAVPGGNYQPREQLGGYGQDLPQFQQNPNETEANIFQNIFKKRK